MTRNRHYLLYTQSLNGITQPFAATNEIRKCDVQNRGGEIIMGGHRHIIFRTAPSLYSNPQRLSSALHCQKEYRSEAGFGKLKGCNDETGTVSDTVWSYQFIILEEVMWNENANYEHSAHRVKTLISFHYVRALRITAHYFSTITKK